MEELIDASSILNSIERRYQQAATEIFELINRIDSQWKVEYFHIRIRVLGYLSILYHNLDYLKP